MKLTALAAAGLTLMTGLAPVAIATPAAAQRVVTHERTVVRHGGHRWRWRQVCRVHYRHGHRVRVCRRVRY